MRSKFTVAIVLKLLCLIELCPKLSSENRYHGSRSNEFGATFQETSLKKRQAGGGPETEPEAEYDRPDGGSGGGGGEMEEYEVSEESVTSFEGSHTTAKRSTFEDLYINKPEDIKKTSYTDDIYDTSNEYGEDELSRTEKFEPDKFYKEPIRMRGEPNLTPVLNATSTTLAPPPPSTLRVELKKPADYRVEEKLEEKTTTQKVTEKSTEQTTEKTTEKSTERSTERSTEKSTERSTERSTEKVAEKSTEKGTEKSTEKITEKPTEKTTEKPVTSTRKAVTKTATPKAKPKMKAKTTAPKRQRPTTRKEKIKLSIHRPGSVQTRPTEKPRPKGRKKDDSKRAGVLSDLDDDAVIAKIKPERLETEKEDYVIEEQGQEDADKVDGEKAKVVEIEGESPETEPPNEIVEEEKVETEKPLPEDKAQVDEVDLDRVEETTEEKAVVEEETEAPKKKATKEKEKDKEKDKEKEKEKEKLEYDEDKPVLEEPEVEVTEKKSQEKTKDEAAMVEVPEKADEEEPIKENKTAVDVKAKKPQRKPKPETETVEVSQPKGPNEKADILKPKDPEENRPVVEEIEEEVPVEEITTEAEKKLRPPKTKKPIGGVSTKVMGGTNIDISLHPYVAMLVIRIDTELTHLCTAAIISREWAISCAHCFYVDGELIVISRIMIVTGQTNTDINDLNPNAKIQVAEEIHIHPGYKEQTFDSITHDVGLVKVRQPFVFNEYCKKIGFRALPLPKRSDGDPSGPPDMPVRTEAFGWGRTAKLNYINVTIRAGDFNSCPCMYW